MGIKNFFTKIFVINFVCSTIAFAENPITTDYYSADPAALVYNDSLFIFTGHDEQGPESGGVSQFWMNDWHVLVTDDMVNYHDYGNVMSYKTFKWANGSAFAGHCEYYKGKFYWFVAVHHGTIKQDEGFAIGVAVADHPSGPWMDAIGQALITDNTPNDIALNIDPAIFFEGDEIWLYWGSWGACRRVKLKDNMIELNGNVENVNAKGFFEAPWVHKYRGKYYFSYASGYPSTTNYSISNTLAGPWEDKGIINDKIENSETNHQAIIKYLGHWYFVYHGALAPGGWTYRRSVNIDYLYYDENANIQKIKRTTKGIDKVNNALIKEGLYKLKVSHSGLFLQDENGVLVQQENLEKNQKQFWIINEATKKRFYTIKNVETQKYYCPSNKLLDSVKTSVNACEIRIENASESKGYYIYSDYESDFVADVLNISKEALMPVITWVRTGNDNQKIMLVREELPDISSSSSENLLSSSIQIIPNSSSDILDSSTTFFIDAFKNEQFFKYDVNSRMVLLNKANKWFLFDLNGCVIAKGFGKMIDLSYFKKSSYIIRVEGNVKLINVF